MKVITKAQITIIVLALFLVSLIVVRAVKYQAVSNDPVQYLKSQNIELALNFTPVNTSESISLLATNPHLNLSKTFSAHEDILAIESEEGSVLDIFIDPAVQNVSLSARMFKYRTEDGQSVSENFIDKNQDFKFILTRESEEIKYFYLPELLNISQIKPIDRYKIEISIFGQIAFDKLINVHWVDIEEFQQAKEKAN